MLAGAALVGCTADSEQSEGAGQGYGVTMEPVGTVTFGSVPETWALYFPGYANMGVAPGQAD